MVQLSGAPTDAVATYRGLAMLGFHQMILEIVPSRLSLYQKESDLFRY